jgi:hypothetical protein
VTGADFPGYPMIPGSGHPEGDPNRWIIQPHTKGVVVVMGHGNIWFRNGDNITRKWTERGAFDNPETCFDFGDLYVIGEIATESVRLWKQDDMPVDVLAVDLVSPQPIEIRLQILTALLENSNDDTVRLSPYVCIDDWGYVERLLEEAFDVGMKSIILKRMGSTYSLGEDAAVRSADWIEIQDSWMAQFLADPGD